MNIIEKNTQLFFLNIFFMNLLNTNKDNYKEKNIHTTQNHLTTNPEGEKNGISFKNNDNTQIEKNKIYNSDMNYLQKSSIPFLEDNINLKKPKIREWSRYKITKKIESKQLNLYLFDDNGGKNYLILYAKKENKHYTIYNEKNNPISYIKWNFLSSNFKVYDNNNKELLNIIYDINIKGLNGPIKMKIILTKDTNYSPRQWYNNQTKSYNNDIVYVMENKQPVYNQIYKCYVLKFIDRKIKTSSKNFQIVFKSNSEEDQNNILLQFAETEQGFFILDYKFPFNDVTAFAVGLIANSSKILCEY